MRVAVLSSVLLSFSVLLASCATTPTTSQKAAEGGEVDLVSQFAKFVDGHVSRAAPLEKELGLVYWEATTTGNKEAYKRVSQLEIELRKLHSDAANFEFLKKVQKSGAIVDDLQKRQLTLLLNAFEENQIEPALMEQMVKLSTEVQQTFSDFRGTLDGKPVTDNQIKATLKTETDSEKRKLAWQAYKSKGQAVSAKVLELVKLRNQAAKKLGYQNFYEMRLRLIEQDPDTIKALFDKLAQQTDKPFAELKREIDVELSSRYGVKPEEMLPWHYEDPFFQEAPTMRGVDLDPFFAELKLEEMVNEYFRGIGLDPQDIMSRSDLYEKQGKMPHAYCIHIDRSGDVRILVNLKPTEQWASTLMHEMGHAVYDNFLDMKLPWVLRGPSHSFATEAIAMLFGRQTRNPTWLAKVAKVPEDKLAAVKDNLRFSLRLSMLVFARWAMVMMNFERELYANPDQDLNKLWWQIKKRYQLIEPPAGRDAPDWASKIHIAVWPAYYHNYLLGEMMASQLLEHISKKLITGAGDPNQMNLSGDPKLGGFLKKFIFEPGASLRWDELLRQATGESLNPAYFAKQFVNAAE